MIYCKGFTFVLACPISSYRAHNLFNLKRSWMDTSYERQMELFQIGQLIDRAEQMRPDEAYTHQYFVLSLAASTSYDEPRESRIGLYQYQPASRLMKRIQLVGSNSPSVRRINLIPHFGRFHLHEGDKRPMWDTWDLAPVISTEPIQHPRLIEHWLDLMNWTWKETSHG